MREYEKIFEWKNDKGFIMFIWVSTSRLLKFTWDEKAWKLKIFNFQNSNYSTWKK